MRTPFTTLIAVAAPLRWADVNTDDIAPVAIANPIARLRGAAAFRDPANIGDNAFAAHRWTDDGQLRDDFVLNVSPYDRAAILVTGPNFGCGSSRETAVWSLQGLGIQCIIAASFGEIFEGNCVQNGVLPIRLPSEDVEELMCLVESAVEPMVGIDLERCLITRPDGRTVAFSIGEYHREALLGGHDEIEQTLTRLPAIEAFEAAYHDTCPWLLSPVVS